MTGDETAQQIQERLKEKFKDKSTRELLESIPPDQKALLKTWFGARGSEKSDEWPEAPAYWLTANELRNLSTAIEIKNLEDLVALIQHVHQVPRDLPEIETTLFGEFVNMLAGAGVPVPESQSTPYGSLIIVSADEAPVMSESVGQFLDATSDETLSDPQIRYLILYNGEVALVRSGLEHLRRALAIPSQYAAALLLLR